LLFASAILPGNVAMIDLKNQVKELS
jgi:hypothetical protein